MGLKGAFSAGLCLSPFRKRLVERPVLELALKVGLLSPVLPRGMEGAPLVLVYLQLVLKNSLIQMGANHRRVPRNGLALDL